MNPSGRSELDALIREARRFEAPSPHDRAVVRRGVELRIAAGSTAMMADGAALAAARPSARRAAGRLSPSTALLPVLVLAVLAGITADVSVAPRAGAPEAALLETPLAAMEPPLGDGEAARVAASEPPSVAAPEQLAAPLPAPSRRIDARAVVTKPSADAANLAAESRALAAVQRALRDAEHERALRLLDEQDRTFARGVLGEERAAARVLALCATNAPLAERARAGFAALHPRSALLARVESACAPGAAP